MKRAEEAARSSNIKLEEFKNYEEVLNGKDKEINELKEKVNNLDEELNACKRCLE